MATLYGFLGHDQGLHGRVCSCLCGFLQDGSKLAFMFLLIQQVRHKEGNGCTQRDHVMLLRPESCLHVPDFNGDSTDDRI